MVHVGGQSFGPLGLKPDEGSMARLLERHPDYLEVVSAWIQSDPLADRRAALVAAHEQAPSVVKASGTLASSLEEPEQ